MSKSRHKPKRLFSGTSRLPADARRQIDELTTDPVVRQAAYEAVAALFSDQGRVMLTKASRAQRAAYYLAMRDAAQALKIRKPCDFCPKIARRVRLVTIPPAMAAECGVQFPQADLGMVAFMVMCDACARMSPAEMQRKTVKKYAGLNLSREDLEQTRRTTIVGHRIGDAHGLPPRCSLQDCGWCGHAMWFDQDECDVNGEPYGGPILFLCVECAIKAEAEGRLERVPMP
jgi:hypothetical protein